MNKLIKYLYNLIIPTLLGILSLASCKDFFDPRQDLNLTQSQLYKDWYEYRSVAMGLYGMQQQLVEQLVILGELRSDLLTVTQYADADMVEINNFNVSKNNKYASPTNFFKLISACNNFIGILQSKHPEVIDPGSPVTNYDRIYGEALCMRAWAYFNAARIYGKVPYIYESLTTIDEIQNYVNSPGTYIDSVYITFALDGYHNDTIHNKSITLDKKFYDLPLIIDLFTNQLEKQVKAVGVDYAQVNNDNTWGVTTWNTYAMHALLGQMYLTQGNYAKAYDHFDKILHNSSDNYQYQLDRSFAYRNWRNIFSSIDPKEHIYTIWFNKTYFQQNQLQSIFVNKYMLKPTYAAILKWENIWQGQSLNRVTKKMTYPGFPGDFYRGYFTSFAYVKNGNVISSTDYMNMLSFKLNRDTRSVNAIMDGADTIAYKYMINKDTYDQDANFIVYRAAGINLYMAELLDYRMYDVLNNGTINTNNRGMLGLLNNGSYYNESISRRQLGIRGRVGFGSGDDAISESDIIYLHDSITNEVIGFKDFSENPLGKKQYYEEQILDERARELAFEGERFYDLMRVAKRRNDPSFLAKIVSAKYPAGQRGIIYNYLLDENNWYIKYFQ